MNKLNKIPLILNLIVFLGYIALKVNIFLGAFLFAAIISIIKIKKLRGLAFLLPLTLLFPVVKPFALSLEELLDFIIFGLFPFLILFQWILSYSSLEEPRISLRLVMLAILPLIPGILLVAFGAENFMFSSVELITPKGLTIILFSCLFVISAMVLSEAKMK